MCTRITDLPEELLWAVLGWLTEWDDLSAAACTCRTWNRVVDEPLWQTAYANRGWLPPSLTPECWKTAFRDGGARFAFISAAQYGLDGLGLRPFLSRLLASLGSAGLTLIDLTHGPLPDLTQFEAVATVGFPRAAFGQDGLLGDALANYVDAGGGVVVSCYAPFGYPPAGRWCTRDCFDVGKPESFLVQIAQSSPAFRMDPNCDAKHPLLHNVGSLSFVGPHGSVLALGPGELAEGSVCVASWVGGAALVAVRPRKHGRDGLVVALNIDPAWKELSGDAAALVANALQYTRRPRQRQGNAK